MKKVMLSAVACTFAFSAVSAEEIVSGSIYDSVYGMLGIGGSFLKSSLKDTKDSADAKANRVMGVFGLGAGKVFKNFYVGGEFLMDMMKSKDAADVIGAKVSSKGFRPALALRFGYVFNNDLLAYAKVAGVYSKISVTSGADKVNVNKVAPEFDLGIEKAFCKKFSARLEAGYALRVNKDIKIANGDAKVKANKGWNVRALVSYNIKY